MKKGRKTQKKRGGAVPTNIKNNPYLSETFRLAKEGRAPISYTTNGVPYIDVNSTNGTVKEGTKLDSAVNGNAPMSGIIRRSSTPKRGLLSGRRGSSNGSRGRVLVTPRSSIVGGDIPISINKKGNEEQSIFVNKGNTDPSIFVNEREVDSSNLRMAYAPLSVSPGRRRRRLPQGKPTIEAINYGALQPKVRIEDNNLQLIPRRQKQTRIVKRMRKGVLVNVEEPIDGGRRTRRHRRRHTRRRYTSRRR